MKKSDLHSIALSGINASDNPGPGVPIARSIKEAIPSLPIIGLSYDVHDSGNYLDSLFQKTYRMPFPSNGWNSMEKRVLEIKAKHQIGIIIPSLDAELPLYIRHQKSLEESGVFTFLPTEEQFQVRSKDRLEESCKKFGLRHPRTFKVNSIEELINVLSRDVELPCMIKG